MMWSRTVTFHSSGRIDQFDELAHQVAKRSGLDAVCEPPEADSNGGSLVFANGLKVDFVLWEDGEVAITAHPGPEYLQWVTIAALADLGADVGDLKLPPDVLLTWDEYRAQKGHERPFRRWWRKWFG